jgi:DNA-binding transcriptional regulator GbsR (MarR family)
MKKLMKPLFNNKDAGCSFLVPPEFFAAFNKLLSANVSRKVQKQTRPLYQLKVNVRHTLSDYFYWERVRHILSVLNLAA